MRNALVTTASWWSIPHRLRSMVTTCSILESLLRMAGRLTPLPSSTNQPALHRTHGLLIGRPHAQTSKVMRFGIIRLRSMSVPVLGSSLLASSFSLAGAQLRWPVQSHYWVGALLVLLNLPRGPMLRLETRSAAILPTQTREADGNESSAPHGEA